MTNYSKNINSYRWFMAFEIDSVRYKIMAKKTQRQKLVDKMHQFEASCNKQLSILDLLGATYVDGYPAQMETILNIYRMTVILREMMENFRLDKDLS